MRRIIITLLVLVAIAVAFLLASPDPLNPSHPSEKEMQIRDRQVDRQVASADEEAILDFVDNHLKKGQVDSIGLRTPVSEMKLMLNMRRDLQGTTTPVLANGSVVSKRMSWTLSGHFDKPFGTDDKAFARMLRLNISLTEQAVAAADEITQDVAARLGVKANVPQRYAGVWVTVSHDMTGISIDLAGRRTDHWAPYPEHDDGVTYDFR